MPARIASVRAGTCTLQGGSPVVPSKCPEVFARRLAFAMLLRDAEAFHVAPRSSVHAHVVVTVCAPSGCKAALHLRDIIAEHFGDAVELEQLESSVAALRQRAWVSLVQPTLLVWNRGELLASAVGSLPDREVRGLVERALDHC